MGLLDDQFATHIETLRQGTQWRELKTTPLSRRPSAHLKSSVHTSLSLTGKVCLCVGTARSLLTFRRRVRQAAKRATSRRALASDAPRPPEPAACPWRDCPTESDDIAEASARALRPRPTPSPAFCEMSKWMSPCTATLQWSSSLPATLRTS